jgi:hypothetical protein
LGGRDELFVLVLFVLESVIERGRGEAGLEPL